MSPCPSREQLRRLLLGELPRDLEPLLSAHVETCVSCQCLLEGLTAVRTSPPTGAAGASGERPAPGPPRPSCGPSGHKLSDDQLHRLRHLLPPGSSAGTVPSPRGGAAGGEGPEAGWPSIPGYEILRQLGRGGMAVVYEARQLRLNRCVALKVLRAGDQATPEQLVRFCAEGEIVARLRHPNIVQIYEVGTHNKQPYFALELMEGGSLAAARAGKPLAARPAAELVETLARAMDYAHSQGIVHRDLNPSNVLLTPRADRGPSPDDPLGAVPKISDFGLAKHLDQDTHLTRTGFVMGTPGYMAPEQIRGHNDRVGPGADVYALGAILYELLTGRPPFQAPTPLEVMNQINQLDPVPPSRLLPGVPRDLEVICLRCLEKQPERRYPGAAALADDLRRFRAGEPIRARRVPPPERAWRWARRRPAPAALLLLVLLVAVVGFPAVTLLWLEAAAARQRALDHEREAVAARNEARAQRNRFQQQSAEILLGRGLELAQRGEVSKGLHWMLEGLRTSPAGADDFRRVARTNLAAWGRQVCGLRHLLDHPDEIDAVAIRPDGKAFVTGCLNRGIYTWDAATGRPLGKPIAPPGQVLSLAYSPDGKVLLAGGGSHQSGRGDFSCWVRRWDAATGEPLGPALAHDLRVWAVAYSPDGKTFLVGAGRNDGRKGQVRLWDAATGEPLGAPLALPFTVKAVAFSPDGKRFVAATGALDAEVPGRARVWDTASRRPVGRPLGQPSRFWAVCFSPDGKSLWTADDGAVRRWDPATGKPAGEPLRHPSNIRALALTPDGATLVVGCSDGIVRLWDAATDQLLDQQAFHEGWVSSVAVGPDGRTLLTGARGDRTARVWEVGRSLSRPVARGAEGTGVSPSRPPAQRKAPAGLRFRSVAYSPDRRTVLTGSAIPHPALSPVGGGGVRGLAQLWDAATGRPLGIPLGHPYPSVRVVAFSPDGKKVATASMEETSVACAARVWDASSGRPLTPWLPQGNHVAALAFSPDGKLLATGDYNHEVHLWDAATGKRVGRPLRQRDIVLSLAFSPDGRTLAAGTAHDWNRDPQARLWDVAAGRPVGGPLKHSHYVVFVAFSPDGKAVVTGSEDGTFRLWDAATGEPRGDYRTVTKGWRCAALSPAGDRLVTAGGDGTARLWGTPDGTPLPGATLPNPREVAAVAVAFSPDSKLLVVGHEDGSAQLWDVTTGKPLGPPVVQHGPLLGVAFAADGRSFLSTAADGTTRAWPVPAPLAEADLDRLTLLLEVQTALRMDEGQTVTRLTPREWRERSQRLAHGGTAPEGQVPPPPSALDWHDARARDAEQTGQPFTARWHLDRLIAQQPNDWQLYARRARTYTDEGKADLAEADYRRALERGGHEPVLAWYRHRAWACQARRQWSAALSYLDRLLRARPEDPALLQQRRGVEAARIRDGILERLRPGAF
jgi:eukaryotic-like serine/threonine-protein kinase